jgi:hypothetical protein
LAQHGAEPKEMLLSIRAPIGRRRPGRTIAIVDEEWRVCIALDEVPRAKRKSRMKSLVTALRARLGDQASISSGNERIFIYTTTAASAAAIAQEARDVLASKTSPRRGGSAPRSGCRLWSAGATGRPQVPAHLGELRRGRPGTRWMRRQRRHAAVGPLVAPLPWSAASPEGRAFWRMTARA